MTKKYRGALDTLAAADGLDALGRAWRACPIISCADAGADLPVRRVRAEQQARPRPRPPLVLVLDLAVVNRSAASAAAAAAFVTGRLVAPAAACGGCRTLRRVRAPTTASGGVDATPAG